MSELHNIIQEAVDNALKNGFDVRDMDPAHLAHDLFWTSSDMGDTAYTVSEIEAAVKDLKRLWSQSTQGTSH